MCNLSNVNVGLLEKVLVAVWKEEEEKAEEKEEGVEEVYHWQGMPRLMQISWLSSKHAKMFWNKVGS